MASKRWGDPGDLTRSWLQRSGPRIHAAGEAVEWARGSLLEATGVDCWADGDYARVVALGSLPDRDIPAAI
jgi:hypothetical protein